MQRTIIVAIRYGKNNLYYFAEQLKLRFVERLNQLYQYMRFLNLIIIFCGIGLLCAGKVSAQVKFSEGILQYRVQVKNAGDSVSKEGTYTIHIKEGNVRKELHLPDGYDNITLTNFNLGKHIILHKINRQHYAVEMSEKEHRKSWSKYSNANYKKEGTWLEENVERPEEQPGQKYTVKYKDGKSQIVYAMGKYFLDYPQLFERTPDLKGIPVAFSIEVGSGFTMSFRLVKCSPEPVSNAVFRIPEGYRIISRKEYDKLAK